MTLLGIGLFVLIFAMLTPAARSVVEHALSGGAEWTSKYAPLSYLALAMVLIAPIVAAIVVMNKKAPPEPENPLAKYKNATDVLED
jgi:hypothetical protein